MTGLCQYYDEVLYPDLVNNKDLILKLVTDFFNLTKDKVPINPKVWIFKKKHFYY